MGTERDKDRPENMDKCMCLYDDIFSIKMDEPEKTWEGMKTPKNFVENKYMWIHICTHSGVMCQVSEKIK